jgi:hypothetical protein
MGKFAEFVERIASEEDFERKFLADPEGVVGDPAFGLTNHEQNVILNGTAKKIRDEVMKDRPAAQTYAIRVKMR